jgi:two-component system, OmpR family, alkaline phosphatase synthesis response regulator PhoP
MQVLIVDDEADIREVARLSLELIAEWTVSVAENGAEAVEQAILHAPDVILLDMVMPGIDGIETFQRLSQDPGTNHIPVIFLTALAHTGERRRLEVTSARGLVAKPFDPLTLAHDIERILSAPSPSPTPPRRPQSNSVPWQRIDQ